MQIWRLLQHANLAFITVNLYRMKDISDKMVQYDEKEDELCGDNSRMNCTYTILCGMAVLHKKYCSWHQQYECKFIKEVNIPVRIVMNENYRF